MDLLCFLRSCTEDAAERVEVQVRMEGTCLIEPEPVLFGISLESIQLRYRGRMRTRSLVVQVYRMICSILN